MSEDTDRPHDPVHDGPYQIKCADKEVRVQQVIVTHNLVRGQGTEESPFRKVRQVWSMEGELIAERDPCQK